MTVASGAVTREVPLMPGGRRVLGHAVEFGRDPLALLQRAREHGDVVRIRFGPFHVFVLNSPDAIRQALVSQARKLEKGLSFGRAKRLIGNGLVMAEGESHRRQRRLMQPAFHRAQIARYLGTRNCIGEGFAWTESLLLLSSIAARWHLRLADSASVHPVVSSTLVPNELPIILTRRA